MHFKGVPWDYTITCPMPISSVILSVILPQATDPTLSERERERDFLFAVLFFIRFE